MIKSLFFKGYRPLQRTNRQNNRELAQLDVIDTDKKWLKWKLGSKIRYSNNFTACPHAGKKILFLIHNGRLVIHT